ncbi:MAG: hypothetical protein ACI4WR_04580, partial [Bulleidia sp.]
GRKLAIADVRMHSGGTAVLMIAPEKDRRKEEYAEGINVLTEKILKLFHPHEVLIFTKDPVFRNACIVCCYYPKGRLMRYVPDPWRYRIPDSCFDEEGYLIYQGRMKEIPFGLRDTSETGCGWIACWNLMKMLHQDVTMEEACKGLSRYNLTGGLFGQDFAGIVFWLKKHGVQCSLAIGTQENVAAAMQKGNCGILLYRHKTAAHYTAFRRRSPFRFQFYNAVYGQRIVERPEEFLKKRSIWPAAIAVLVQD